ncbi:MAG: hypothetical protein E6I96_14940 [Chloroflexi bacterium]|nr:MAG: hypothetical protein E6I96_14940 [Chloroflexota bacterium]
MRRRLPVMRRSPSSRSRSERGLSQASLRERLTRLGAPPRHRPPRSWELPRGFEEAPTPFGVAAVRQDVIALPALDPHPGSIAYVDTETTGLAGGAGTYIFAAAVATAIPAGLRVVQLFLPEPGMESAFLHALRDEVEPAGGLATFNGGSFDLPILRTRWVMARMPGEFSLAPHVDLLTLVRALYRHRLENCTLRYVEQRVLGYERDDPLSSALVPDAYFPPLPAPSPPAGRRHRHGRRRLAGARPPSLEAGRARRRMESFAERDRLRARRGGRHRGPAANTPAGTAWFDRRRRPTARLAGDQRARGHSRLPRSGAAPGVAARRPRPRIERGRGGAASDAGGGGRARAAPRPAVAEATKPRRGPARGPRLREARPQAGSARGPHPGRHGLAWWCRWRASFDAAWTPHVRAGR